MTDIHASLPQAPQAALSIRPLSHQSEQASLRPVDRPHHDEPINNQQDQQPTRQVGVHDREARHHKTAEHTRSKRAANNHHSHTRHPGTPDPTRPTPVGKLLDVIA